ncbi:hypothetical protein [Actinomadura rubrisoli]|uniref:Uncharacterized protein n=1 Tax=Actinomadura rubrisoli TaxID=2530368 RepID=A0A4R5AYA4_9ACTN|nr:hypothetical protein [Actinomadura rubrisoli]TDD76214.1 hypothetical protein E1298_30925 [Actinomadura rubrisoli]
MQVDKPRGLDEFCDLGAQMYGPVDAVYVELRTRAPLVDADMGERGRARLRHVPGGQGCDRGPAAADLVPRDVAPGDVL